MITIPDIRQSGEHNCGEVIVTCAFRLFGVPYDAPRLATEADGMHPSTIEGVLRNAGLHVQSGTMTLADLAHHTRLGRLVCCPINIYGGHWVGVAGTTSARVRFHCPVKGDVGLTRAQWLRVWKDSTRAGHAFDSWGIATWLNN